MYPCAHIVNGCKRAVQGKMIGRKEEEEGVDNIDYSYGLSSIEQAAVLTLCWTERDCVL